MCRICYLGSSKSLPLIDKNGNYPGFAVTQLEDEDILKSVQQVLDFPLVYILHSWQGCGCGFTYENRNELITDLSSVQNR